MTIDAIEEQQEEVQQGLVVITEEQSPQRNVSAEELVEMCVAEINSQVLPEQKAERSVWVISQLVENIEKNMIALGYVLYYMSDLGLGYWKYLGGAYKSFNAWCSLDRHLNSGLVNDAIRLYLNWTDLRKFEIDADTFTREPPSPVKSQILRSEMHEFDRKKRQLKQAHKGTPEELDTKINQLVEQYKIVLEDILVQPDETLIEEDNDKKGKVAPIKAYFTDITWDREQMQWDAHVRFSVSSSSERTLAGIVRDWHNCTKGKFQNIAELEESKNTMGLLGVADYMENMPITEEEDDDEEEEYDEDDEEDF